MAALDAGVCDCVEGAFDVCREESAPDAEVAVLGAGDAEADALVWNSFRKLTFGLAVRTAGVDAPAVSVAGFAPAALDAAGSTGVAT